MSRLLEILGRAITVDTAELIWHWLDTTCHAKNSTGSPPSQHISKIIELIADRKTESAEKQLRLYLFDNPACPHGRLAASAICLSKNQLTGAVEELKSVYVRHPNNTMALYALGHCYERLGFEAEALEFYQDSLKFKNYLLLPRQRLAAINFKNRQFEKTIQEYELLRAEYPDDVAALVTLGHLYMAVNDYQKAMDIFNTAILIHPDNFRSDEECDDLLHQATLHQALEYVDGMLEQQPARVDLAVKRAEILAMLGDDEEAVTQYQHVLNQHPDCLEARIKLGTQYLQMQCLAPAAQQFNRAAEINDQIVEAYFGLATTQKLAGKMAEALATLSLAAAIQPNSSILIAEAAALHLRMGLSDRFELGNDSEPDELMTAIIQSLRSQLRQRPQNPEISYRLGILLMNTGDIPQAVAAFQNALQINPTHYRATTKLAICLFETNQKQVALNYLTGPQCINKDTLELHYKTALLYCDKVMFASSLLNLERQLETNFAAPDATVNISVVLQNLGLLDRADAMWDSLSDTADHAINSGGFFSSPETF